ncbi:MULTISPECIES: hypothetical protein [Bacillus cereus group]|uniref:Group-specific protein n=1 Tax=Bacillus cereus TaxID=1396 RepID=A0AA44TGC2_BACCE|nr:MULTISPECIES: hypothetical protein [Bacillus cereus group]PFA22746.1 hypothetical protein CN373_09170 [Bacillus cereus]PFN05099.1 hypothetical protein COJ55_19195 [Bacillus cereus]PFO79790.1 hypothetical protein COJ77_19360 [Bacillus cereus]PFR25061.1 hypothetical protein COK19_16205 [Bacillus cereus]PFS07074.1 hypothetical protein COK38_02175 [Bacillus cereus]
MRRKKYKCGDRVKINLNKSVSPEMITWINKQSDVTSFFLYGVQQLFKQVGDIDVSKTLPNSHVFSVYIEPTSMFKIEVNPFRNITMKKKESTGSVEDKPWALTDELDCPFF